MCYLLFTMMQAAMVHRPTYYIISPRLWDIQSTVENTVEICLLTFDGLYDQFCSRYYNYADIEI